MIDVYQTDVTDEVYGVEKLLEYDNMISTQYFRMCSQEDPVLSFISDHMRSGHPNLKECKLKLIPDSITYVNSFDS